MEIASFGIDQRVTIKASRGRLVSEPADMLSLKLEDLVAGITDENVHNEIGFGRAKGKEAL